MLSNRTNHQGETPDSGYDMPRFLVAPFMGSNDETSHNSSLSPNPKPQRFTSERIGLAIAGGLHAALIAALSLGASVKKPPEPIGIPVDVSLVTLPGAPPPGSPKGNAHDGASLPSTQPAPAPEAMAEPAQTPPAEILDQPIADQQSVDAPAEQDPPPIEADDVATSTALAAAPTSASPPDSPVGTGSLALGAKSRGSAAGQNPQLAEAISRAIATRIRQCWTPPRNGVPMDTSSTIIVRYNPDGTLNGEPRLVRLVNQVEQPVTAPNKWELDALGALQRCSPMNLAPAMYPYWQEVSLSIFGAPQLPSA